jgi:tRNA(Ile)-lysidine synthase
MMCDGDQKKLLAEVRALSGKYVDKSEAMAILRMNHNCASPVCIACSGGSDSVFLALLFRAFFGNGGPANGATLLHLNHNLRGEESLQDAKFVAELAKYLELNFISGTLNKCPASQSEGELRDLRYEFFARQMKAIGSNVLLLGHHKNDVAETLIMRLTRASGLDGLTAPREVCKCTDGTTRLRPLLAMKKSEIEEILGKIGAKWRVDSSNFSPCCLRNVVRNVVLGELQRAIPQYDIVANICESRRELAEINEFIENKACRAIERNALAGGLDVSIFRNEPSVIVKRALRKWLLDKKIEIGRGEFENLANGVKGWLERCPTVTAKNLGASAENCRRGEDIRINAAHGNGLILSRGILATLSDFESKRELRANFYFRNWCHGSLYLPNGRLLSRKLCSIESGNISLACDPREGAYVAGKKGATFSVQNFDPRIGYVRFGHESPKKLAGILGRDMEIYRDRPVIFMDNSPCWVPGLSVSNLHRVKDGSESALLLTYS